MTKDSNEQQNDAAGNKEPLMDQEAANQNETQAAPVRPPSKDNRCLAIVTQNILAIVVIAMNACYKVIAREGFSIIDFVFLSNLNLFFVSIAWCWLAGLHPYRDFPWDTKGIFFARLIFGQTRFATLSMASVFAPLALTNVVDTTSPFLISISAFFFLGEPIIPLEILSMLICFGCVAVIGI